jgi:hypothetical protein
MLECIRQDKPLIPETILSIAYIALSTATPLHCWQRANQVMIVKGEGCYIKIYELFNFAKLI